MLEMKSGTELMYGHLFHWYHYSCSKLHSHLFMSWASVKVVVGIRLSWETMEYVLWISPWLSCSSCCDCTAQGGYLGQVLLGMCRWPLRTPTPL